MRQPALSPMACKFPVGGVDSKKVIGLEPSFLNLTNRMSPRSLAPAATKMRD